MKRWVAFVVSVPLCWGLYTCQVAADDPVIPAVLNNPAETVSVVKQIINRIQPSYETVWDVNNGDFYQGVSGSLYNFTSKEIPIASLRLGASTGMAIYGGVSLDLPGLTKRLVPSVVASTVSTSPMVTIWSFIGKYGRVGFVGGYSWDHDDPVVGVTAGAAFTF